MWAPLLLGEGLTSSHKWSWVDLREHRRPEDLKEGLLQAGGAEANWMNPPWSPATEAVGTQEVVWRKRGMSPGCCLSGTLLLRV